MISAIEQEKGYWARSKKKHVRRIFSTIFLLCFVCINIISFANFFSYFKWLFHYQLHICQQNLGPLSVYIQYYVCSHYILIGYVIIICKHWRLCIRVVLQVTFPCKCFSWYVPWTACQLMCQCQHSSRACRYSGVAQFCLRWHRRSQGMAGRIQCFPWQPRSAECKPWAAAAGANWYLVDLAILGWSSTSFLVSPSCVCTGQPTALHRSVAFPVLPFSLDFMVRDKLCNPLFWSNCRINVGKRLLK